MMKHANKMLVVLGVAVLCVAASAQAAILYNATDSTHMLGDSHELAASGTLPGTLELGTYTDAAACQYGTLATRANGDVAGVTARYDQKFLEFGYVNYQSPTTRVTIQKDASVASEAGDTIQAQFSLLFPAAVGTVQVFLKAGATTIGQYEISNNGTILAWDGSAGHVFGTDPNHWNSPGTWNDLVLQYVNGSADLSVSVNGNAFRTVTNATQSSGNVDTLGMQSKYGGGGSSFTFYEDAAAVPEPATMALLGAGGLLALVRRRRK